MSMNLRDTILHGDALSLLRTLPSESVQCCVTSPPYWSLRDYGTPGQLGLEATPDEYVARMVEVFREVRRVLRNDGTCWINLGDSYAGSSAGHAKPYGTSGIARAGSPVRDSTFENLCGACLRDWESRTSRTSPVLVPTLAPSLSGSSHEHTASGRGHLPTSDSPRRAGRNANATQGQEHGPVHEHAALLSAQVSTTHESSRPLPAECSPTACDALSPSRLDSSTDCVLPSSHTSGGVAATSLRMAGSGAPYAEQARHIRYTAGNCSQCGVYSQYLLTHVHPHCTTSKLKHKDLIGMPWRLAFALQADGWYLRADIIWAKKNAMPESVSDRPTKAHEYLFLLSKRASYYYDADAIREEHVTLGLASTFAGRGKSWHDHKDDEVQGDRRDAAHNGKYGNPAGRNKRSVWTVATAPFSDWAETSRLVRVPSDAAGDGTKRITSADCPVHGDRSAQVPTARCDPHADDVSNRNGHSDARPAQVPAGDCATIDQPPGADSVGGSSDLILLPCEPSATRHSKRTRKTGRDPVTTQPYMPSGETSGHIEYTSTQRGSADSVARTFVSNTATADSSDHPSAQTEHHNEGTFSSVTPPACTCSFYQEITEKTSHFATFPPKLIEPCILAGSASKACEHCGAPWRRVTSVEYVRVADGRSHRYANKGPHSSYMSAKTGENLNKNVTTTGWRPTCRCADNTGSARSLVLDPFMGAGTVGVVCRRHSRHYLGIELNAAYIAMAETRIADEVQPALWTAQGGAA